MTTTEPNWEEFLSQYDMWNPEHEKLKWEAFSYARSTCPVPHTSTDGGFWIVTRYEDVRRVLEDPKVFSSTGVAPRPSPVKLNPLDADPPFQTDLRKLLNPLFSRTALLKFEPMMREFAGEIIDRWIDKGEVDLISDFAAPFVGAVLAKVVYDERDEEKMAHAVDVVTQTAIEGSDEAFFELAVLAAEYLMEREDNPVERDDVLNAVMTGTVEGGRPLTEDERLGVLTVLFLGGLDTTRGAIGAIAFHVANDPALETRLRNPDWVRWDLDEFIRLDSPVGCLARIALEDAEVGGVQVKAGDHLLIRYDSANRDESQFVNPDRLSFGEQTSGHAGFGLGVHRCLGAQLARIQIGVAFDELFKRLTNLRPVPGEQTHWAPGIANGPEHLVLAFDKVSL